MEGKIEGRGRRGRKCKQLHYDHKEKRGFCKLKEEALDRICGEMALEEAVRRGEFRPRQTRQLPRAVDLIWRLLSCQNY